MRWLRRYIDYSAGEEHGGQAAPSPTSSSQGREEQCRLLRRGTTFPRRVANRLYAEAVVDEQVAEAGDRRVEYCQRGPRREPDQPRAAASTSTQTDGGLPPADPVRQVPEDEAPHDEGRAQIVLRTGADEESIASKPTPPGARPRLGTETGPTALVNEGRSVALEGQDGPVR
jgi:hypothetical protein